MIQNQQIDIIPYLIRYIQKEKQFRLLAFSSVLVIGVLMLFFFGNENTGLVIVAMMLIVTGLKFLTDTIRIGESKYHPMIKTLSFHPEQIVWVYTPKIDNAPFGIQLFSRGRLVINLLDRTEFSVAIPYQDSTAVTEILQDNLIHATFGYSTENLQFYKIDPYLLLKDN